MLGKLAWIGHGGHVPYVESPEGDPLSLGVLGISSAGSSVETFTLPSAGHGGAASLSVSMILNEDVK